MKLEQSFEVGAPVDEVWAALIDVQRVAPCLPGAEITEAGDDGVYHGTFTVKLGPTTASYRGKLELQSVDEAARAVTMKASGSDKRGQGGANATMVSRMASSDGGGTRVEVETDFTITGRLARFGRGGMIQDVSNRLLADFAACLADSLGTAEPEAAAVAETAGTESSGSEAAPAEEPATAPEPASRPAPQPAKPINGLRLMFSVLWKRIARLFGRGR